MKFNEWALIEAVLPHAAKILLYGPPGTGKTYAASLGLLNGKNVHSVTMTEETPSESLRGHFVPAGNVMRWMDGPAIAAWRGGDRLVINEIDHALGDALDFLHVVCDDPQIARISLPKEDHELVQPAPGFQVVATMNGEPGDLPEALRDRFQVKIRVTTIAKGALDILSEDLRKVAVDTSTNIGSESRLSVRAWHAYDKLRVQIGEEMAAQAVFGARADELRHAVNLTKVA